MLNQLWNRMIVFACLCMLPVFLFAGDEKINVRKLMRDADRALKSGNLYVANDLYLKIMMADSTQVDACFKLADTYYTARDYEMAARWYSRAVTLDSSRFQALFNYGINLKMQGKYKEALAVFKSLQAKIKNNEEWLTYRKWTKVEADGCSFALKESRPDPFIKLEQLNRNVNGNYTDVSPSLYNQYLYFSSIRSDTVLVIHPDSSFEPALFKMFRSPVSETSSGTTYGEAQKNPAIAVSGMHTTNGAFSSDGQSYLYTVCTPAQEKSLCRIWESKFDGTNWDSGTDLGEAVNFNTYTTTHPYRVKMKNGQDVLFFSSDRPGGKGGMDIWFVVADRKGNWGIPKNAGGKINTDRDEVTPYYNAETQTLYFSSNGWISMGGYDIFQAKGEPGRFESAQNLGSPFNSPCEDLYYRPGAEAKQGYLVSNRPGIFSVKGKTCCHDIFSFTYQKQIQLAVSGRVFLEGDATKTPLVNIPVQLYLAGESGTEGTDVMLNRDTTANRPYLFVLKADKDYKVVAAPDGYFSARQSFSTQGLRQSDTLEVDLFVRKLERNKEYRLNNIYYDFDKWDLRPESKSNLDSLYRILTENPTIIIELGSHTDVRGSDAYNQTLSQKRAESCVQYLLDKGIPRERISAKGYGESQTLSDCSKVDGCVMDQSADCPCHQLNRRTVFKVVGELDGKLIQED